MSLCRKWCCSLIGLALILILAAAQTARAEVRQAREPVFDRHTQSLLATVQGAGTDLPMSLHSGRDVYLFITAGGAYTEVKALALPTVSAAALAQALDAAARGTNLHGQTVLWSSNDYSAAQLRVSHGHLLGMQSANMVPVGPLIVGLRRAGFLPHCLLRIPIYASAAGFPPPCHPPIHWRWYDESQVAQLGIITISAKLPAANVTLAISFVLLSLLPAFIGLGMAVRLLRNEHVPFQERRNRTSQWMMLPVFLTFPVLMPVMVFFLRSLQALADSDIWFGSSSVSVLIPVFLIAPLSCFVTLPLTLRAQRKYLGPVTDPIQSNMTLEEKAVHRRLARWTQAPHLLLVLVLIGSPWLLPHHSALYRILHPLSFLMVAVGTMLTTWFFKKPLSAFTQVTVDDDLTWRARQLSSQLGVRVQDVKVEDSTAASVYAQVTSERGGHLKVSRKLVELLTLEEMDYVLAREAAQMHRRPMGVSSLLLLIILPSVIVPFGIVWMLHGHAPLMLFNVMPYLLAGEVVLLSAVALLSTKLLVRRTAKKTREAHEAALRVAGNPKAAGLAVLKMAQHTPVILSQTALTQNCVVERLAALQTANIDEASTQEQV